MSKLVSARPIPVYMFIILVKHSSPPEMSHTQPRRIPRLAANFHLLREFEEETKKEQAEPEIDGWADYAVKASEAPWKEDGNNDGPGDQQVLNKGVAGGTNSIPNPGRV